MNPVYMRPSEEELAAYDFLFWREAGRPGPQVHGRGLTYADIEEWSGKLGCSPRDIWIGKVGEEDDSAVPKIRNGGPWSAEDPEVWLWDMDWHSTTTFLSVREREPNGFEKSEGQAKWIDYASPVLNVRPYMVLLENSPADQPDKPRKKGFLSRLFS